MSQTTTLVPSSGTRARGTGALQFQPESPVGRAVGTTPLDPAFADAVAPAGNRWIVVAAALLVGVGLPAGWAG